MIPGETDYPKKCEFCGAKVERLLYEAPNGAWYVAARCSSCGLPYARLTDYYLNEYDAKVAYEAMKGGETWMLRK